MKIRKLSVALGAALIGIGAVAQADHFSTGVVLNSDGTVIDMNCASFGGLKYTLDNYVTFANEDKDRPALDGKLVEAHDKLHEGKKCDAAQKLLDFSSKIDRLTPEQRKPKIFESYPGAIQCLGDGSSLLAAELTQGVTCEDPGDPPRGKGKGKQK